MNVLQWKLLLSEKRVLNYTTLGFQFIKGLSSHKWNENHPSNINAVKLYHSENFHFMKSVC